MCNIYWVYFSPASSLVEYLCCRYINVIHSPRNSMVHGSIRKRYVFVLQLFIVIHSTILYNMTLQIARKK